MSTMLSIDGTIYKQSDLTRVSALVMLKASEELPQLGLTATWDDLVTLMRRSSLPAAEQGTWTQTDALWMTVFAIWATLNAAGHETSLLKAMDLVAVTEMVEGPDDHQGKAKAPQTRQGSGRGGAKRAGKPAKTLS